MVCVDKPSIDDWGYVSEREVVMFEPWTCKSARVPMTNSLSKPHTVVKPINAFWLLSKPLTCQSLHKMTYSY